MVELLARSAFDGVFAPEIEGCELHVVEHVPLSLIMPFRGKENPLGEVLKKAHAISYPANGRSTAKAGVRCVWFGLDQVMLIGARPDKSLKKYAAVVDQSDSWAVVRLQGVLAKDVLARLTPLDLRSTVFKRGHTARSMLGHMNISITRVGPNNFEIMAFASMAKTLVHELAAAMKSVGVQR